MMVSGSGETRGPILAASSAEAEADFSDIARHNIIEVMGDDVAGRKIICISACRLPSNKTFDYNRYVFFSHEHFHDFFQQFQHFPQVSKVPHAHLGRICEHGLLSSLLPSWPHFEKQATFEMALGGNVAF